MDGGVAEESARGRDVGLWGRLVVAGNHSHLVEPPKLAARHPTLRFAVSRVEATMETELKSDSGRVDLLDQALGLPEIECERLLAEDGDAAWQRPADEIRVRIGGCGDHHRVRSGDRLVHVRGLGTDRGGYLRGATPVRVSQCEAVDERVRHQHPGVQLPDTSHADLGEVHHERLPLPSAGQRSMASSTLRPMAAASLGGSQLVSCSTINQPR